MSNVASTSDIQRVENAIKNLERKLDNVVNDISRMHNRLENLEKAIQQEDVQTDKIEQVVGNIRTELTQVEQRLKQHVEQFSTRNNL
jgi:peptidoglycan hydrolase CwlO-like protein